MLAAALAMAACSSGAASTTTAGRLDGTCQSPPTAELETDSTLEMSVDPNPVMVRETASLTVSSEGLAANALAGVDARWQCWDGSRWVTTHAVYRGFGDNPGQTIPLNADFQIRVPSIGLELDEGFPIVIPQVEPGTYRIEDEVIVEGDPVTGFVIVEVVS